MKKIKFSARAVDCWSGYRSIAITTQYHDGDRWLVVGRSRLRSISAAAYYLRDRIQRQLVNGTDAQVADARALCGIEIDPEEAGWHLAELKNKSLERWIARRASCKQ